MVVEVALPLFFALSIVVGAISLAEVAKSCSC